jgi:hypothetical protein
MIVDTNIAGAMGITGDRMGGMGQVKIINSIALVLSAEGTCDAPALMIPGPAVTGITGNTKAIEVITTNRQFERNSATYATPEKTCRKAAANYEVTSKS